MQRTRLAVLAILAAHSLVSYAQSTNEAPALVAPGQRPLPPDPADVVVINPPPERNVLDDPVDRLRLARTAFESADRTRARKSLYDVAAFMRTHANREVEVDEAARMTLLRAANDTAQFADDVGARRVKNLRAFDDALATAARSLAAFHVEWAETLWTCRARTDPGARTTPRRSRSELRDVAEQIDAAARADEYAAAWMDPALSRRIEPILTQTRRVTARLKAGRLNERDVVVTLGRLRRVTTDLERAAHPPTPAWPFTTKRPYPQPSERPVGR